MNRRLFLVGAAAWAAQAQESRLLGPDFDYVLDAEGRVRRLIGPSGSAYLTAPEKGEAVLRQWTGAYGLDEAGRLFGLRGAAGLGQIEEMGTNWTGVSASRRAEVAVVWQGRRIVVVQGGQPGAEIASPVEVRAAAVSADGRSLVVADGERCVGLTEDGGLMWEREAAGTRQLVLAPETLGVCGLGESLWMGREQRVERIGDGGMAMGLSGDGQRIAVLERDGRAVRIYAGVEGAEERFVLTEPMERLRGLRRGRSFLLSGGAAMWTLDLHQRGSELAQLPLAVGGVR
jgi:hypothetical protein